MTDGNISYEGFVDHVKRAVREVGKQFTEPDDDWMPIMHLMGEEGDIALFPLVGSSKDHIVGGVCHAVRMRSARMLTMVHSAWFAEVPNTVNFDPDNPPSTYEDLGTVPPSLDPNRKEAVILTAMTPEKVEMYVAKILRHDNRPPTLSKWERWGGREGASLTGRFVEPVWEALKEVNGDAE